MSQDQIGFSSILDHVHADFVRTNHHSNGFVIVTGFQPITHAALLQSFRTASQSKQRLDNLEALFNAPWFPGVRATSFEFGFAALKDKYMEMSTEQKVEVRRYSALVRSNEAGLLMSAVDNFVSAEIDSLSKLYGLINSPNRE